MAKKFGENGMDISKSKLFWRTQGECWKRMVTPYVMYLFMSMLLLATQAIGIAWVRYLLGSLCILIGAAFNAHLAYNTGSSHFDAYVTGCIHRRNRAQGIVSGGDHHPEREYSPWKGFYIGFLIGIPVILFAGLACIPGVSVNQFGRFMLVMFAGFALIPVSWIVGDFGTVPSGYYAYSMLLVLLPVLVTGIFYIVGAVCEKRKKRIKEERAKAVLEAAEAAREERLHHEQTEEQRRKTLQSKKKKK